ncbi:hypothetical protein Lnau_0834 [Legionella nautarum]|uniref:Glycine-rich protein n=1 Tax=Legionella nautarum TaxID=45070 RepID=A0A0W0WU48_9GAMM|nr:hypothetical protein [Legionella nautarum]KTD35850.1 hypothetical protein Lnau_0834 [Legionella nautarum]
MFINSKRNTFSTFVFVIGILASTTCAAWHGHGRGWYGGHEHYHGGGYGYGWGGYGGGYSYGGGWGGPNIVINVPTRRYYAPLCEKVEVCNSYGECWLETYCN